MTFRADKFDYVAEKEDLMTIQGEAQKYQEDYAKIEDLSKRANTTLYLYLQIAYDEGYRKVLAELKNEMPHLSEQIKIVPRKKGWFEYIEDDTAIEKILPLLKKRIKSKRQRNAEKKHKEEQGGEFSEEIFTLCMVIQTGFEQGYAKASSLEETAKIVCKDQERADLVMSLFNEMMEDPKIKEHLNG